MMKLLKIFVCLLPTLSILTAGCTAHGRSAQPFHTQQFGESYRAFFPAQVVNRDAPRDRCRIEVMPGKVSAGIYDKRYIPDMTEKKEREEGKMETQFGN
jgi:hypothetical protein